MSEETEKNWWCVECRKQLTETEAQRHVKLFNHNVKQRVPLSKRIVCQSGKGGNLIVTHNGEKVGIVLTLLVFKNPATNLEGLSDPQLSLMGSMGNWEFCGSAVLSGDLVNISKKLSFASGQQSKPISPSELKSVLIQGIESGKCVEFGKNLLNMNICLDTDLKLQPRNKDSVWVIATENQLKRTFVDEIRQREEVGRRAREIKSLHPVVG